MRDFSLTAQCVKRPRASIGRTRIERNYVGSTCREAQQARMGNVWSNVIGA
jgi:hypothetical protein